MTWVYIAVAVIAISGAAEAKQQREAGRANQAIEENNARLANAQAQDAANIGARESEQSAWRTRALIGQQRAAIASAGLDSELGTPFDLQTDAALFGGADKSAIQMDAARKAWGFQSEALNAHNRGALANWQGQTSSKITVLKTIGSALGTFAGAGAAAGAGSGGGSGMTSGYAGQTYTGGGYGSGYTLNGNGWRTGYGG